MVLYQQIVVTLPKADPAVLTALFRRHATTILGQGGVVRGIENHGIRPLPEMARRKFLTRDNERKFWSGRFSTVTFDASPEALKEANRVLRTEENVLRFFTVKVKDSLALPTDKTYRNPYLNIDNTAVLAAAKPSDATA